MIDNYKFQIGIIGVGYVGLPLAIEFSKFNKVIAYDHNKSRISRNHLTHPPFTKVEVLACAG